MWLPDAQQMDDDDDTYDDGKDSADIGEEASCMSSVFILYQGSKRKDPEIGYLQKANVPTRFHYVLWLC